MEGELLVCVSGGTPHTVCSCMNPAFENTPWFLLDS